MNASCSGVKKAKLSALSLICLLFFCFASNFSPAARAQLSSQAQPKLVLLLVIDQFSFDYLSRFQDRFGAGGFRYLMDNGANFLNCTYKQASTVTAVGHSVIATGAYPWATGIIGNDWYSRRREKPFLAVEDDTAQIVGGNGVGASCRHMSGTTIGDEMRLASNGRSKVFSMSLKDRGALFLAGRMANCSVWFDPRSGQFVSSSQFGSVLPGWVRGFNDKHYADGFFGKPWNRLLPENLYNASTKDDYTYERALPGDGRVFPHIITAGASSPGEPYYTVFMHTPFANQMLADLAKEAIEKEGLGVDESADLLAVSFSSTDYLGHLFGPNSQEIEDMMLRLDQTLASLFQFVDQKVGLDKCLVILSGDHGVMPIPEFLRDKGIDAGRIDPKALSSLIEANLDQKLGQDDWVASFQPPNLFFNRNTIAKQKVRKQDAEDIAAQAAESIPGVGDVYTAYQFYMNQMPPSPNIDRVKKNYFSIRSGDLTILPKAGFIFSSEPNGTSHGSPFRYDSQVPLIMMGVGIKQGRYGQDCSPADIAPTIASILQINLPSLCEGRTLSEALTQISGPSRPLSLSSPPAGN